ncbi:MAG: hypothetical protein ACFCVA_17055 [Gammaproteobacteria bacterium]
MSRHLTTYRFEPRIPKGRHTGTDGRYPDHPEVAQTAIHGDWVPAIPAGTTGLKELIGGKESPPDPHFVRS